VKRIYIRKLLRDEWVKQNIELCNLAYEGKKFYHSDWKTEAGRKIVEMVRREIGYKCSTGSGDIYYKIYWHWKEFKNKNVNK
jgi:hypothetical protein